ncbi:3-oxoacid CoA-transferase subunit A [Candidimonas sp. SYP-B2681]|uniref:3-oxoacid CoA-transferase subunit A n=1 Tax=Candidimonas sp. SYP-B2681 TaxID=2497686 RepID=UPI000F8969D7|nr:3-oxoacid CoA-transferase subunit A [Candidimonas sp. SYP-B2681]RTZ41489.1 3-oxoacid CoA-transferase subunit A [Candidimonas sp. SYP-B2681]
MDKTIASLEEAVADVTDGSTLMISGFGGAGLPFELVDAVLASGARNLTIISNNAGSKGIGIAKLVKQDRVRKVICSFPRQPGSDDFDQQYRKGGIELELVPQGTLAERIRAGGAGIGAFFTPTGVGTELAVGKEVRSIGGIEQVLEHALVADFALIKANTGDRWGNLTYRGTARNFGPVMATAARCTIAQVNHIVPLGDINPEHVVTAGIYVNRVVLTPWKH